MPLQSGLPDVILADRVVLRCPSLLTAEFRRKREFDTITFRCGGRQIIAHLPRCLESALAFDLLSDVPHQGR